MVLLSSLPAGPATARARVVPRMPDLDLGPITERSNIDGSPVIDHSVVFRVSLAGSIQPVRNEDDLLKGWTLGGLNWSSQHVDRGGPYGQASWVDDGVDGQGADEVAGEAIASPRRGAVVLA